MTPQSPEIQPDHEQRREYSICGTRWFQAGLKQREYEKLKEINKLIDQFMEGQVVVKDLFDMLNDKGHLRTLVNTVLKPDEPTVWAKIKNRWIAWRRGVDLKDPYSSMTNDELAIVGADYFFFRTRWIGSFFASPSILESISRIRSMTPEEANGSPSMSSATN